MKLFHIALPKGLSNGISLRKGLPVFQLLSNCYNVLGAVLGKYY